MSKERYQYYKKYGKRIVDIFSALLGLSILCAPIVVIGVILRISSGPPVIYRQLRVGQHGKFFHLIKYRTMVVDRAHEGSITMCGDDRITKVGRVLRKYKLDELLQLINVIKGDMSFVGPRPDVPGYADKLEGEERKILSLKPGITGPATLAFRDEEELLASVEDPVKYNDEVIYPKKVMLNMKYVDDCSFTADIIYILKTVLGI